MTLSKRRETNGSRSSAAGRKTHALVHASDSRPGITRRVRGKGFEYFRPDGKKITDAATLDRIRALAVPPAWSDVWISPGANGHIQATGRDEKGRKQYRYHQQWTEMRGEAKFASLLPFAETLADLRARIDEDLTRRKLGQDKIAASIVWLMDHTMIRIGNPSYAEENRSFGLTTLRKRHIDLNGNRLRFDFVGKSGKRWTLGLTDRRIARIVRQIQDLPGQALFQYLDDSDTPHPIGSEAVNDYIRDATGSDFTSKHLRTWGGTVRALDLFASTPPPEAMHERRQTANRLVDLVAGRLGNTRTVCRSCYIHPAVFEAWEDETLVDDMAATGRRLAPRRYLDAIEARALSWLRSKNAAA